MKVYLLRQSSYDGDDKVIGVYRNKVKAIEEAIRLANENCANQEDGKRYVEYFKTVDGLRVIEHNPFWYPVEEYDEMCVYVYKIIEQEVTD